VYFPLLSTPSTSLAHHLLVQESKGTAARCRDSMQSTTWNIRHLHAPNLGINPRRASGGVKVSRQMFYMEESHVSGMTVSPDEPASLSHDISMFANVTPAPLSRIPLYRGLLDEASSIDANIPMYTPSYTARSQPIIPPINRFAEKTGFFKFPAWTSFLPRCVHIKPDNHPIQDCPSLPPPPTDIMDHHKPVKMPSRKPPEQRKPHKDFALPTCIQQ